MQVFWARLASFGHIGFVKRNANYPLLKRKKSK